MRADAPLRVAVLGHTAAMSGAEVALTRMLRCIDRSQLDVVVLLFGAGPLVDRLRALNLEVQVLDLDSRIAAAERSALGVRRISALRDALVLARYIFRLARVLRRMHIDVVHCNSLKADLIGGLSGRLAGCRVAWYVHDRISDDYLPPRTAALLRFLSLVVPHRVITNSRATLDTLRPSRLSRYTVAYPGLDDEDFADTLPPPPANPTVGIVGRLSPTKGQDVFLRAASIVASRRSDVRFRIIGSALFNEIDFANQLPTLATQLGISSRVEFGGQVSDVRAAMVAMTAVVHASPVPEPFGQVIVEAMAVGAPVIATDAGGVREITGPSGELALLVPPNDVPALAAAIDDVLGDREATRNRALRAQVSVRRRFRAQTTADTVISVWLRLARPR